MEDALQEIAAQFCKRRIDLYLLKVLNNGNCPLYYLPKILRNALTDVARKRARTRFPMKCRFPI